MISFVDKVFAFALAYTEASSRYGDERCKSVRHIRRQGTTIWANATDADLAAYAKYQAKQFSRTIKRELREAKHVRALHRRRLKNKRSW